MKDINATGGFDKVLQLSVVERGMKIRYLEQALVFDEKIENSGAFGHQRRRWLSSQFLYLRQFFFKGFGKVLQGNIDYFNLAVVHNIILPRVFLLGLLPALWIASLLFKSIFSIPGIYWGALTGCFYFSLLIALPGGFFNKKFLFAAASLPKAFGIMVISLLRIRGANRHFLHTSHYAEEVDNPLFYADEIH